MLRRLLSLCASEPHNVAAIRSALDSVDLLEIPRLQIIRATEPADSAAARPTGSLVDLLRHVERPTTLTLVRTHKVDVTLWALPPGACLPLHDHPGMTVLNRVMAGRMHELSFDWADGADAVNGPTKRREAKVVANKWRTGGMSEAASATDSPRSIEVSPHAGGVLHAFTAAPDAPVLFIDVIAPPYFAEPDHINCTYFDVEVAADRVVRPTQASPEAYTSLLDGLVPGTVVPLVPCPVDATPDMDCFAVAPRVA